MQLYVQKSISTTLPLRPARVSGASAGVLSQPVMPVSTGAGPQFSRTVPPSVQGTSGIAAVFVVVLVDEELAAGAGAAVRLTALAPSPVSDCSCLVADPLLSTDFCSASV